MRRFYATSAAVLMGATLLAADAGAVPTREQYRYFRALSIDLQGRVPTVREVAEFERPGFNVDGWIDQRLTGPAYAERMRRLYMDLLRLEVGPMFNFVVNPMILRRARMNDPTGRPVFVYFRRGQRRDGVTIDSDFCMSPEETGVTISANGQVSGTARNIDRDVWESRTVEVRPWWLYRDYRASAPTQRITPAAGANSGTELVPQPALLVEPDNRTPSVSVRVCREESQSADRGTIYLSGRTAALPRTSPYPGGRVTAPPTDGAYARARRGQSVSCLTGSGISISNECGCGVGLERCMPGTTLGNDPGSFMLPDNIPLGVNEALDQRNQSQGDWSRFWWSQEAVHFLDDLFANDRDFREVLTSPGTVVNGPLSQFYRGMASTTCCGNGINFDYAEPTSLFETARVPNLLPQQLATWQRVENRGPNAAGVLTMPIFLTKYGTRRARAHIVYNAFLCRQFVAENLQLQPSTEPNLMVRSGCAACHVALEPLSAYFARVQESGWTFYPAQQFPVQNTNCNMRGGALPGTCSTFYDPQFTTPTNGMLRGAYGSTTNADAGPVGMGRAITAMPEFAQCAASQVAESFLGRSLTRDDTLLREQLTAALRNGGFHPRALVRAMLRADAYRNANNLSAAAWREGAMP